MRPFCLALVLLFACGGDDDGGGGDGGGADAGGGGVDAGAGENHLGETCSDANPCPADHDCVYLTIGNPDLGYCSPVCASSADCLDGYSGPATGTVACFVPDQPEACSIACETGDDCPGELACVTTGGPMSFCTTE